MWVALKGLDGQNNPSGWMSQQPHLVAEFILLMGFSLGNTRCKRLVQTVELIGVRSLLGDLLPTQIPLWFVWGEFLCGQFTLTGQYITREHAVLITSPAGSGRSFLASALGNQGCQLGYRGQLLYMQKLIQQLVLSRADGSILNLLS